MNNNGLIVIGSLGYPSGTSPSNRVHLYCKALKEEKEFPFIINIHSPHNSIQNYNFLGRNEGIPFYYCQKTHLREKYFIKRNVKKIIGLINSFIIIKRLKKNRNITVLFFSISFSYEFIYYLFLMIIKVPIIRECNETPLFIREGKKHIKLYTFFLKHVELKMYDGIIVISDFLYKYYSAIYSKNKIFQIPILVDMNRFNFSSKNENRPEKIITYIGYMGGNKDGLNNLIEAIAKVKENIKKIKLELVGSAPEKDLQNLKNKISYFGLNDDVIFLGSKNSTEIPQILANSDLLVLARPNNNQAKAGFPTKLGEYLASKKPVVITKTGEIPKFLQDNESAYLVEPDDNDSFAKKIIFALNDTNSNIIGLRGFDVANKNFNYRLYSKRISEILHNYIKFK